MTKMSRLMKSAVASVVALALVALAPGLASYEAAAQVVNGAIGAAGRGVGAPVVPVGSINAGGVTAIPAGANLAPALNSALTFAPSVSIGLTAAPAAQNAAAAIASLSAPAFAAASPAAALALPVSALLSPSAPVAATIASLSAQAGRTASPIAAVERAAIPTAAALRVLPSAADGRESAPTTLRGRLAKTAGELESAESGAKAGFLDKLFTGARSFFGLDEPAPVAASAGDSAASAAFAALTPNPQRLAASTPEAGKPSSGETRATPPSPVVKVGDGLNPGAKLLAGGEQAPAAKPEAPKEGPGNDDWIDTKGMTGMFIQRSISIALFIQTALAYPFIAMGALKANALAAGLAAGPAGLAASASFGALMALGPLAAIATGPLNGLIADKMSPRNGIIMLNVARAVQCLALPVLAGFGFLNFWTLLAMSIANGWQLSLLMTSENAYLRRLAGKNHLGNLNALNAVNYLALQVFLTLILGVGAWIDKLGLMTPYWATTVILPLVVCPMVWFMIPKTIPGENAAAKAKAPALPLGERLQTIALKAKNFAKKYWAQIGVLGAAGLVYQFFHTTLPMSAALLWWVSRTDGFKAVWSQKNMRATMLLSALAFGLIFPFQYMALPLMAGVLGGVAGKAAILSQLLGALFFGQLAANASQANLPSVKIPFTDKKVKAERLVQGLVLVLGAAWSLLRLFPGNWLAAAASVGVGATMMYGSSKLTDKGWVKFLGVGLAAASILPLVFWGSLPVIFAGMLGLGLFVGPVQVALNTYFGRNARSASIGNAFGVSSSLNNSATSFGYGLLTALVGMFSPVFPHALMPIAVAFAIIGAIFFFFAPKLLPGLADSLFHHKGEAAKPADKK
jgi:hypothetical protein